MKLIKPSFEILNPKSVVEGLQMLKKIEAAGRTCYKSEDKMTQDSSKEFVRMIIDRGHESVLEHEKASVRIICDRGVSHELVRHRLASFSQESTRYCNYSKDKHGNQLTFIIPEWMNIKEGEYPKLLKKDFGSQDGWLWGWMMREAELTYMELLENKWTPQQARSILPNSLKTEIVVSANLREWRLIFKQRTAKAAHPQMREIMIPLHKELSNRIPVVFENL